MYKDMKLRKAANTDNLEDGTKERKAFSSLKKTKPYILIHL